VLNVVDGIPYVSTKTRSKRSAEPGKLSVLTHKQGITARYRAGKLSEEGLTVRLVTVMNDAYPQDLVRHVAASTGLPEATATRVVADVTAYFTETLEEFVKRRHAELRDKRHKNDEIWPLIAAELTARRFGAPDVSERQLRRMVYG
jgi:hypothetical protein